MSVKHGTEGQTSEKHEEHKEGFIHRSYHLLFIIYAPLALISIALNVFSEKYIDYIYMTAFLAAIISVVLAAIMWILFWKHREIIQAERKANLPYLIRHQFILMYLPIAFLSMGLCAYYVYDKYVKTVENYDLSAATKVSLLLPIKNQLGRQLEDVNQVKQSLGSFLINNPDATEQYHFKIVDHKNHYNNDFEQMIVEQLQGGTQYFICAYSEVCATLSPRLEELSKELGLSKRPVMITTLSSSMTMPLEKNYFYRLFVRNREDAQVLAKHAFDAGIKSATFIATDDAYGHDAVKEFKQSWQDFGGQLQEGLYLDPVFPESVASEKILEQSVTFEKASATFVALYQPATSALSSLSKKQTLLFSANYQHHLLQRLAANDANIENIVVSFPDYKAQAQQLVNTAGAFVYIALEKLISVDKEVKEGASFHEAWIKTDEPAYLKFTRDGENDFSVSMQALPYSQFIDK